MIAVLTADLVNSSQLDKQAYVKVIQFLKLLLSELVEEENISFEISRGDSFQIVFTNPVIALRLSLLIKFALLSGRYSESIKVTQSLAVGEFEHLTNKPGESSGAVFINSGRGLDNTAKGNLSLHSTILNQQGFHLATQFLNHHLTQLSKKQAEVSYFFLKHKYPEQGIIASELKITRQNVATHLKRAGADLIKTFIIEYESLIQQHLEQSS
ncbi:hypothetical protein [Glaciecola sp. KUL10]|uniref:hypothetical protein n=1 Tax=Glaciecola sp. (strain KUL10) TaxID=2161813 RepID=UPI000D784171|nr:hypothetical protein [Glaciecola sp. KUL10]GBL02873.1 hypothetical protein KUL10_01460 [Glaciecola sp. KUL10]